jgi:hypothetical protein
MLWTRPAGLRLTPTATLGIYLFANLVFWPPALGAEFVGRKLQLSMAKVLVVAFALSASFAAICIILIAMLHPDPANSWPRGLRDILDCATVNALGFILYRFLSAREPRIDLLRRA